MSIPRSSLVVAALLSANCSKPEAVPATPPPAPHVPALPALTACLAAATAADWAKLTACYAPDAVMVVVDTAITHRGGSAIVDGFYRPLHEAYPELKIEPQLVLNSGEVVVAIVRLSGASAGKSLELMAAARFELGGDGIIHRESHFLDLATARAQLGQVPTPHRTTAAAWPAPGATVQAGSTPTEAANLEVARALESAFRTHDPARLVELMAETVVDADLPTPTDSLGPKAVTQRLQTVFKGSPKVGFTLYERWAAGDYVVTTGALTEVADGSFAGLAGKPTGATATAQLLELVQVKDGKLAQRWRFWNRESMQEQLAAPPPPKAATEKPAKGKAKK